MIFLNSITNTVLFIWPFTAISRQYKRFKFISNILFYGIVILIIVILVSKIFPKISSIKAEHEKDSHEKRMRELEYEKEASVVKRELENDGGFQEIESAHTIKESNDNTDNRIERF